MFIGSYENQLDAKSRMIIPAKYREALGRVCVITRGFDTCLDIYPEAAWAEFEENLDKVPMSNKRGRNFVRKFRASAIRCEIDKQGRLTIPQELKDVAQIKKDLTTIGNGKKIEVWSREIWNSEDGSGMMDDIDIAEGMEEYGI